VFRRRCTKQIRSRSAPSTSVCSSRVPSSWTPPPHHLGRNQIGGVLPSLIRLTIPLHIQQGVSEKL
jgi:hypothetical protein